MRNPSHIRMPYRCPPALVHQASIITGHLVDPLRPLIPFSLVLSTVFLPCSLPTPPLVDFAPNIIAPCFHIPCQLATMTRP